MEAALIISNMFDNKDLNPDDYVSAFQAGPH